MVIMENQNHQRFHGWIQNYTKNQDHWFVIVIEITAWTNHNACMHSDNVWDEVMDGILEDILDSFLVQFSSVSCITT